MTVNRTYGIYKWFLICILLSACRNTSSPIGDLTNPELRLTPLEHLILEKLDSAAGSIESIWPDYDLLTDYPGYIVFNENGQSKGYLLNSTLDYPGDRSISSGFNRIKVKRNDDHLALIGDPTRTSFSTGGFTIEGVHHYLFIYHGQLNYFPFYINYKDRGNNFFPTYLIHELFHYYQSGIEGWDHAWPDGDASTLQWTEEAMAMRLLYFDFMQDVYFRDIKQDPTEILKAYVALISEVKRLDNSTNKAATNRNLIIETTEGTARYVEHFSIMNTVYPPINDDPSHGWRQALYQSDSWDFSILALDRRIWYHTGAAATLLLKEVDPLFTEKVRSQTLYEIASHHLDQTERESSEILLEIKNDWGWENYLHRASQILSLPQ